MPSKHASAVCPRCGLKMRRDHISRHARLHIAPVVGAPELAPAPALAPVCGAPAEWLVWATDSLGVPRFVPLFEHRVIGAPFAMQQLDNDGKHLCYIFVSG